MLTVGSKVIAEDGRSLCSLRLVVGGDQVTFSHGDRATVQVYEDDVVGDDEVYSEVFEIGPLEVGAGEVDRLIDCSGALGRDAGDAVELYARALVEKSDCGLGCRHDRPRTPSLSVQVVGDDGAEDDDARATATSLAAGQEVAGRRALDEDWFRLQVPGARAVLTLDVVHRAWGGALGLRLEGAAGTHPAQAQITGEGARWSADVDGGAWYAVVSPEAANDPNFYDLRATVGPVETQCTPGAESEAMACGACGSTRRTCDEQGRWGEGTACQGEGPCEPGDTREVGCQRCARRTDTCGADCQWAMGTCEGEGVCDPGRWESQDCAVGPDRSTVGVRTRVCRDHCAWSAFGPCRTGGEGDEGCPEGRTLAPERCADGVDNDCDGTTDDEDLDCAAEERGGWRLGLSDPCERTSDCDPDPDLGLECIGGPQRPMFEDGYCAQVGCVLPERCVSAGGACAVAFGQVYCMRACATLADCRLGHHCADLGSAQGQKVCVPVCRGHADCRRGAKTFCSPRTGRCETAPGPMEGPDTSDDGGGCSTSAPGGPWPPLSVRR